MHVEPSLQPSTRLSGRMRQFPRLSGFMLHLMAIILTLISFRWKKQCLQRLRQCPHRSIGTILSCSKFH